MVPRRRGKAVVSRNAIKFGFFTASPGGSPMLPEAGESQQEFDAFEQGLLESFRPVGEEETRTVREIASAAWRSRRCSSIEVQIYNAALQSELRAHARRRQAFDPNLALGYAFLRDCRGPRNFERLSRYEARANRQFIGGLKQLKEITESAFFTKQTYRFRHLTAGQ